MKSAGTYFLHVLLVDVNGVMKELVSQPLITKGSQVLNYEFTGRVETATLEAGSYKLEVWGAEGGKHGNYSPTSGKGGYSVGTLTLKRQTKLFIHVGESPVSEKGGWNGGGSGKINGSDTGAGGGGSTDISLYGEEGSTNWNNSDHLYSRIIVAGAGGGSGDSDSRYLKYYGGYGGGEIGQSSGYGPSDNGGTQTRAGTYKKYSTGQGFGVGGTHAGSGSSGGGSGWYGGGASNNGGCNTGGAGGSGFVYNSSTSSNYPSGCRLDSSFYLADSKTLSGENEIPNPRNSSTEKGHSGHGYARITLQ